MSQHRSVWLATEAPLPCPPLDADLTVEVVVVGAGITGLTTALLLQRSGARVAVLDAGEVGGGTTGHTTGKVTSQHTLTYKDLIAHHGEDKARRYADANQEAIRVVAGLPSSLTTDIDLPFPVELALRFEDQAHLHPVRYTNALARAIADGGGQVFAGTRALAIDEEPGQVVVATPRGEVHAEHVVVATLLPFDDRGGFFAKARPTRAYGVSARLAGDAPVGMHISAGEPARSTRPWLDGDRPGLIVVGENHPTGEGEPSPARWGDLERWARQHFDVESFEHRWSAQDYTTADDVPYVGRSPRSERTFVGTGFKKWGLTNGTAAAVILAELVQGRDHPWLEVFDATRIGDAKTVKKLVEDNVHVGTRFVVDRLARLRADSVEHLAPGEGGLAKVEGAAVGAYRDAAGTVHAVSVTCTHMGCTLRWNSAETSWDCPCHGSRFSHEGTVLDGPAVRPLEQVEVDPTA